MRGKVYEKVVEEEMRCFKSSNDCVLVRQGEL